jgi:hypothetical protein
MRILITRRYHRGQTARVLLPSRFCATWIFSPGGAFLGQLFVLLAASGAPMMATAQDAPTVLGIAAVGLQTFKTSHPEGGTGGFAVSFGIERPLNVQTSVLAIGSFARNVFTRDDIALCHGNPETGCLPDPAFPEFLYSLEVQGAWRPLRQWPLRIISGGGISHAARIREADGHSPDPNLDARTQPLWRAGLDISIGSSVRAPRIQLTRVGFWSAPYSTRFIDSVSLVLRF